MLGRSCIRHTSYCRRKSRNPPRSRRKACLGCSKAKTHCDAGFPACSRCLDKNITCRYQNSMTSQCQLQYQSQRQVGIASFTPSSSSTSYLDSLIDESLLCYPSYAGGLDFQTTDSSFMGEFDQGLGLNNFPTIYQPALQYPRLFWPKETPHRALSLNRKYVLGNLRNYPRMMLSASRDGMPPFVHSSYPSQGFSDDSSLSGPLARCAGIVAMWSVKTKYNSVHIWKAIRSEQERLLHEVCPPVRCRLRKRGSKLCVFRSTPNIMTGTRWLLFKQCASTSSCAFWRKMRMSLISICR